MTMEAAPGGENNWVDDVYKKAGIEIDKRKKVESEDAFDTLDPDLKRVDVRKRSSPDLTV